MKLTVVQLSKLFTSRRLRDGKTGSTEYIAWRNMMYRCYKPTNGNFHRYGGKGITVCKRWHDFKNFLSDMGYKPASNLTLNRIRNKGNYTTSNCRWADGFVQQSNKNNNRRLNNGETVAQAAKRLGLGKTTLLWRLNHWTEIKSVSTKLRARV